MQKVSEEGYAMTGIHPKGAMVSWIHDTATGINDIGRKYHHGGYKETHRIDLKNSVLSLSLVVKSGGFYHLCGINSTATL